MDAVIKVGGSLAEKPTALKALGNKLSEIAEGYSIVVVPGGGKFADALRECNQQYTLSADAAHKMAILGMNQFGLLLSQVMPNSCTTYAVGDAKRLSEGKTVPIFLPSRLMFRENPLEASWDVTSDAIAAYIASQLNAHKLILATNVDGIFESDPKKQVDAQLIPKLSASELLAFAQRTSVDKFLPKLLLKTHLECYVVNGFYPERIAAILAGRNTVYTLIKA
jgi:aspartokinase-like uncharacterized kinase